MLLIHTKVQLLKVCTELKLSYRFSTFQIPQLASFQHMTNVILSHCSQCSAKIFLTSLSASFPSSPSKHQIQAICFQFYSPSLSDFTMPIILHKVEKKKSAINFLLFDFQVSPIVLSSVLPVMTVKYLIILLQVSHSDFSSLCIESLDAYIACCHDRYFLSVCHCHLLSYTGLSSPSVSVQCWQHGPGQHHGSLCAFAVTPREPLCTCSDSHVNAAATASKSPITCVIYHEHWSSSFQLEKCGPIIHFSALLIQLVFVVCPFTGQTMLFFCSLTSVK